MAKSRKLGGFRSGLDDCQRPDARKSDGGDVDNGKERVGIVDIEENELLAPEQELAGDQVIDDSLEEPAVDARKARTAIDFFTFISSSTASSLVLRSTGPDRADLAGARTVSASSKLHLFSPPPSRRPRATCICSCCSHVLRRHAFPVLRVVLKHAVEQALETTVLFVYPPSSLLGSSRLMMI